MYKFLFKFHINYVSMEDEKEIKVDMNMMRLSRLERTLDFIITNNPNLVVPSQEQAGQINLQSIDDAQKGMPATRPGIKGLDFP